MVTTVKISELPNGQVIKALSGATAYNGVIGDITPGAGTFTNVNTSALQITTNQINQVSSNSDTGEVAVSYNGYQGGQTKFRDFTIYDGKGSSIIACTGSTKATVFGGTSTAPQFISTGAAGQAKNVVANTGSAYTIDQANGTAFSLTMNAATPTLTLAAAPATTASIRLKVSLIQDGTGGRAPTFANVTWVAGAAPTILQAIAAITQLEFIAQNGVWYGYAAVVANPVVSSTVAIGSATSLTTATATTITSISLGAGTWRISGNIGFISASGTIATQYIGSISTTTNTHATSPNGGAYFESNLTYPATATQVFPIGNIVVSPGSTTIYYLVATAAFSVSTLTAYGAIVATPVLGV